MTARLKGGRFTTRKPTSKYTKDVRAVIAKLLEASPLPRDSLPYTDEFTKLRSEFGRLTGLPYGEREFWQAVASVGKGGGLAGKGGRKRAPRTPSLTKAEQLELLRLMPEGIGNRDQLPYTPRFDELRRRFERLTGKQLTDHEFWRALSRVGKLSRKPKPVFDAAPLGGLAPELVRFLERTNPWWQAQPSIPTERYRRWAFQEALDRLDANVAPVVAIRGPRQVGKTTIQHQIIEFLLLIRGVGPERILRVQFDEVPALGSLKDPVETIVRWFEKNVLGEPINAVAKRGERVYLLFDELQDLPSWSPQLKSLVDHVSARTLVTGSSALRIVRERNSLAGRLSTIELGPLRLYEIAGIRGLGDLPPFAPEATFEQWLTREFWVSLSAHAETHSKTLKQAFRHFSRLGGYPRCHKEKRAATHLLGQEIVDMVVRRTIEHDPLGSRVRLDRRLLSETFRRVCRYAGQSVAPRTIAQEIGTLLQEAIAPARVARSIEFLVDTMLVHQIPPLELLQKKQRHPSKLCICDHFVRNAWLQEIVPVDPSELLGVKEPVRSMAGHIVENIIGYYLMGIPGLEVSWFPKRGREPEVDLILTIGTQRIPVEIKYRHRMPTPEDLVGVRAFCESEHYNAPFGLVVTQDKSGELDDRLISLPASALLVLR